MCIEKDFFIKGLSEHVGNYNEAKWRNPQGGKQQCKQLDYTTQTICDSSAIKQSLFKKREQSEAVQAKKSIRWMPWHREPKKDATTCDKLRLVGNKRLTRRFPNGETPTVKNRGSVHESIVYRGEPAELKHLSRRRKRNQTRFRK